VVNYSHIIGRAGKVDVEALRVESPFGGVPEKVSRWDLAKTETCGGGKVFFVCPLVYWVFIEEKIGLEVPRGAHKLGGRTL
jgi:hypothetical protein